MNYELLRALFLIMNCCALVFNYEFHYCELLDSKGKPREFFLRRLPLSVFL